MSQFTVSAQIVRAMQACAGKKDVREYLNGICFRAGGIIEASNGHIAARAVPHDDRRRYFTTTSRDEPEDRPADRIVAIDAAIPKGAKQVTFGPTPYVCRTDTGKLYGFDFVQGEFPDLSRVYPDESPTEIPGGMGIDPRYLAAIAKVFPRPVAMRYTERGRPLLLSDPDVDGYRLDMLIMPCRINYATFPGFSLEGEGRAAA